MINIEEVKHIAKLARLKLSAEEEKKLQKELSEVLDYFKMLEEIDTSRVLPTFHPTEKFLSEKSRIFRKDREKPGSEEAVEKLISSSPTKEKRYVKVKAVFK